MQTELRQLIKTYRRAIANMSLTGRLTEEQYKILDSLAEAMQYDREAQGLIDQLHLVMGMAEAELIKECILAKEFKTANLIVKGLIEKECLT